MTGKSEVPSGANRGHSQNHEGESPSTLSRRERRTLKRDAAIWVTRITASELPADVKALAPIIAAVAVRTGNSFTEDDVVDLVVRLGGAA